MKSEFNILDDQSKYPDISKMHSKTVKMENLEYENVKPARLLSSISCLVYNQLQPLSSVPSFFCERSILSLQQQPLIPTSNVCPLPNPRTFSEISHYLSLVFRSSQQLYAPLFLASSRKNTPMWLVFLQLKNPPNRPGKTPSSSRPLLYQKTPNQKPPLSPKKSPFLSVLSGKL